MFIPYIWHAFGAVHRSLVASPNMHWHARQRMARGGELKRRVHKVTRRARAWIDDRDIEYLSFLIF